MTSVLAQYHQRVGESLPLWTTRPRPPVTPIDGSYCRLEKLNLARHAEDLFAAYREAKDGNDWTYLTVGPFDTFSSYLEFAELAASSEDPIHHVVIDKQTGKAIGSLALMRIDQANGVIEVGNVVFSPILKRTRIATEAQYLLMRRVFDELGYRRYEWKCDSLNEPSRAAALRLGFRFEGIFRQAVVYKGRSRDTAWFSIIDSEWQTLRTSLEIWLTPENFDDSGHQKRSLLQVKSALSTLA
ncbi:GNAT family N-acetyltransferase [Cupriavidus basilensis]